MRLVRHCHRHCLSLYAICRYTSPIYSAAIATAIPCHHTSQTDFAIAIRLPLPLLLSIYVVCHCESFANTMPTTNLVSDEIDVAVAALKVQKWTATLPFNGFLCKPTDDVLMASFQDCHDLFSLTQTMYKGFIVRFDPQMFPVVPGGVAKNKDSIKKLFDALMCASHHYGYCQLVSHGQTKAGRR
ncbi:hypothetical protein IV203_016465 [Nitzschia inconspicua]|uniref:Uncharacterized protein n=1 Tax=Nitzschia inconspicua TaxID=303405 RepID=A0A9K3KRD1_9STRA|nr:hypothetical protein IV203_016465 [Nitzschia inconspicua]